MDADETVLDPETEVPEDGNQEPESPDDGTVDGEAKGEDGGISEDDLRMKYFEDEDAEPDEAEIARREEQSYKDRYHNLVEKIANSKDAPQEAAPQQNRQKPSVADVAKWVDRNIAAQVEEGEVSKEVGDSVRYLAYAVNELYSELTETQTIGLVGQAKSKLMDAIDTALREEGITDPDARDYIIRDFAKQGLKENDPAIAKFPKTFIQHEAHHRISTYRLKRLGKKVSGNGHSTSAAVKAKEPTAARASERHASPGSPANPEKPPVKYSSFRDLTAALKSDS
ncbi:hypothetical protein [Sulfuricurvum sp.]|uniref:hypothetical protein n=1 Tax=Sulfuricurvum sp. TaxID=2025608 RepID=UPI003569FF87